MPFWAHAPRPGRPALPVTPLRRHIIDADELARLADALGGVGDLGPMAYLGTVDGLRWGEVAGLRIGHLDLEAQTLSVTETGARTARYCRVW